MFQLNLHVDNCIYFTSVSCEPIYMQIVLKLIASHRIAAIGFILMIYAYMKKKKPSEYLSEQWDQFEFSSSFNVCKFLWYTFCMWFHHIFTFATSNRHECLERGLVNDIRWNEWSYWSTWHVFLTHPPSVIHNQFHMIILKIASEKNMFPGELDDV